MSELHAVTDKRLFKCLADDLAQLRSLRPYPIKEIKKFAEERDVTLFVKLEHDNCNCIDPVRSIKRKPASMMGAFVYELNQKKNIWVSASSGNFAIELGILAIEMNKKVFAVVPPRTPKQKVEILNSLGVNVIKVSEEEYDLCPREFTVFMVRALASRYDCIVNIDQYNSILNPLSHMLLTAKEIDESIGGDVTHIFVPLGSTGTLAEIYEYYSRFYPRVKVVGIQPTRIHRIPGVHNVIGECKWSPEILGLPDMKAIKVLTIDDRSAYEALMELEVTHGIHGGPSTGMVFAAVKKEVEVGKIDRGSAILMISADSSWDYREWNMEVLVDLKNDSRSIKKEYLDKYTDILKSRESCDNRAIRVKGLYKSKVKGEIYQLEEFEKILAKI
ncbi:MAG: pyridoxal-phosphate dependent enzyme [Candidatus Bathyarchaeia archaeon]